jgi:hypothetical protein
MLVHAITMLQDKIMKESVKDREIHSNRSRASRSSPERCRLRRHGTRERNRDRSRAEPSFASVHDSFASRAKTLVRKKVDRRDAETQRFLLACSLRLGVSAVNCDICFRNLSRNLNRKMRLGC